LVLSPDNEAVLSQAYALYTKKGMFQPLTELLEARTERIPKDKRAWESLGETWFRMGRFDRAAAAYRKLIPLEPENPAVYERLGNALSQTRDYEAAVEPLTRVAELRPDSAEVHNNLRLVLAKAGRCLDAIPHYEKVIARKSGLVSAHCNFGLALEELGRSAEAEQQFRRSLELDPGHSGARERLKRINRLRRESTKAAGA
jgi:tetratricopeptide (TPR) repeat protein